MKKNVLSFVSGMIVMLMLVGLPVTVLAASGAIRIEVSPISVLVDGEVFRPKDASGNDVIVFTYNGTTYALFGRWRKPTGWRWATTGRGTSPPSASSPRRRRPPSRTPAMPALRSSGRSSKIYKAAKQEIPFSAINRKRVFCFVCQ